MKICSRRVKESAVAYALLLPSLVIFSFFVFYPLLKSFYHSFFELDLIGTSTYIGLGNYQRMITDYDFINSLKVTFIYLIGAVPVRAALALGLALLLNAKLKGLAIYRTVFFMPTMISIAAASIVWMWLYHPNEGLFNSILAFFGQSPKRWLTDPKLALYSIILMTLWKTTGYYMIIFLAGLQGVPEELYEAAKLDGAGAIKVFLNVTWPLISPTTFFILVVSSIDAFKLFNPVYIMTKGGPLQSTRVIIFYLYQQAFEFFRMGYASALAIVVFAILILFTIVQFSVGGKRTHYQ